MKNLRASPLRPSGAGRRGGSFNARAITDTIHRALASAGLDTGAGPLKDVTTTIERALSSAGLQAGTDRLTEFDRTIDVVAREIHADHAAAAEPLAPGHAWPGKFLSRSFTNDAGTRSYKLYVPARYEAGASELVPLVVMLHGCTQSPDDFAKGTRMNELAEKHGFLVAYPGQSSQANHSKCWNWFKPEDQARESGEPSLIAGITREVIAGYQVDPSRVFVAGLSAGAAMAVVLGRAYPDLFAGVGAHSGVPFGVAQDLPSAFAAMHAANPLAGLSERPAKPVSRRTARLRPVPTIVFHGDQDRTVNARNGTQIVEQAAAAADLAAAYAGTAGVGRTVERGVSAGGRSFERTVLTDRFDRPLVEQWVLHGAGHAWSGGSASGSFTDPRGPDASSEMLRFFLAQRPATGS
jgi:poly(hydroxyalkanoate) depolymerase family esterase